MKTVLLCATRRGYRVLERLAPRVPRGDLAVFSFREEPGEPAFLEDIRALANAHGAEFWETRQVGAEKMADFWAANEIDLMLVVSWRYLIPPSIYDRARLGAFVFHDSLLPAYRGFAPTVWAITNGKDHTGATLFRISEEVDAGEIVDQESVPIGPDECIRDVLEHVTLAYLEILDRNLAALQTGTAKLRPQDHRLATYTCRRLAADNGIAWGASTTSIFNLIRAVTRPYPGAWTTWNGQTLRIWSAERLASPPAYVGRVPGRVVEIRPGEGVVVLTGDGCLLVHEVQLGDAAPTDAAALLKSLSHTLGT